MWPATGSNVVQGECVGVSGEGASPPERGTHGNDLIAAFCESLIDLDGLCNCNVCPPPHVPFLPSKKDYCYPECRSDNLRVIYIDDSSMAEVIDLDKQVVPLLPTLGPVGRMASDGLAIPGQWIHLQHKLKDVTDSASAMGMLVNHLQDQGHHVQHNIY